MQGSVKWFDEEKNYGFIESKVGLEYFVHGSDVQESFTLHFQDEVTFDVKKTDKGSKAVNVTVDHKVMRTDKAGKVTCNHCKRKVIPRLITSKGHVVKQVCSYCCGEIYEEHNEKDSGCFIATAVYGDYNAPEVITLRKFRDTRLLTNLIGSSFVKAYYRLSPPLANWLKTKPILSKGIRTVLNRVVKILQGS